MVVEAARWALTHDVAPTVEPAFAQSRLHDVDLLLACADRRRRHGPELAARELDELSALLGHRPASLADGFGELDGRIHGGDLPDDEVLPYLTRRARRDEWLWAPVVGLYPDRRWSSID